MFLNLCVILLAFLPSLAFSHVNPPSHLMHLIDPSIDVIKVIRSVINHYHDTPSTLAKAYWTIVNLSIYAPHKEQVLSHDLSILHKILDSIRQWPKHKQLQHRGFFALINLNNHAGRVQRQSEIQNIMGQRRNLLLLLKAVFKFEKDEKILRSLLALLRIVAFENPKNINSIREMGFVLFLLRAIRKHWPPSSKYRPQSVSMANPQTAQTGPHINVEVVDLAFLTLHILNTSYPQEMQLLKDKYKLHLLESPKLKWLMTKEEEEALMQSDADQRKTTPLQNSTTAAATTTSNIPSSMSSSTTPTASASSSSSSSSFQFNRFPFESAVPVSISSRLTNESWSDWHRAEELAIREHTRSFAPYRTQLLLHAIRNGLLPGMTEAGVRTLVERLEEAERAEAEREERERNGLHEDSDLESID